MLLRKTQLKNKLLLKLHQQLLKKLKIKPSKLKWKLLPLKNKYKRLNKK